MMAGHVYVVHGDLLKIGADGLLIPCDQAGEVLSHWYPYGPYQDRNGLISELQDSRVSGAKRIEGQQLRYVNTGTHRKSATPEWLTDGVLPALAAVAGDVTQQVPAYGRARHLIAMPLFGVGAGGYAEVRGEALVAQLDAARDVAADADVDVVIVCFERSDFAAIERQRTASDWDLTEDLRDHAASLADAIKDGRLVLFLGAGVSAAASIGDFAGLVAELERRAGVVNPSDSADLPTRVAVIEKTVMDKTWMDTQVADLVQRERYALTHGLLASLRVWEAITTNFDQLYEMSCERPFLETPLEVLPWERGAGRSPWLLKAHGDPLRPGELVLSAPSFAAFEADRATTAGVVRAMLALSREVLFVGYSLNDPNIAKLVEEADATHRRFGVPHAHLGTIVDIESTIVDLEENPARLGIKPSATSTVPESALRLQIWLDYIVWLVAKDESSWLLDKRYAALHDTAEERAAATRLAGERLPSSDNWQVLERRLRQFGKRES